MGIMKNHLPIMQSDSEQLTAMQTRWSSIIGPVLSNALVNGAVLKRVTLSTGSNVVNHKLGRKLQGWFLTRQRSAGSVYDTQDTNNMPDLTLNLEASANLVVDLYVF